MHVTEAEARQMRCCGAKGSGKQGEVEEDIYKTREHDGGGRSTFGRSIRRRYCIASECMAWRWGKKRNPLWKPGHLFGSLGEHPDEQQQPHIEDTERGFCGLAGRP